MSAIHKPSRTFTNVAIWALGVAALLWVTSAHADGAKNQVRALSYHTASWSKAAGSVTPGTTTVRIAGSRTPTFTVYKLSRPSRIVVDIAGAALASDIAGAEGKATWSVGSWSVGQVTAHPMDGSGGSVVRVVVEMARPGTYKVKADGNDVLVTVTPRESAPRQVDADEAAQAVTAAREQAKVEMAELEQTAQANLAEAERARRSAAKSESEATRARKLAEKAQADAEKAQADADKAKRALADAQAELDRVRSSQASSAVEIARARRWADSAKADAERALKQAAERAAKADRMQKEAETARTEVVKARSEADRMKREAERVKAEAERMQREAKAALQEADSVRAEAKAEAAELRKQAQDSAKRAEEVRAKAEAELRDAESRKAAAGELLQSAERKVGEAKRIENEAREAREQAEKRQDQADMAEKRAREEQAQARRAQAAAERYREQAASTSGKEQKALRKRAEEAAAEAERRKAEAEAAASAAERTRRAAEEAAHAAEERQQKSLLALKEAEKQRAAAEKQRAEAEKQRAAAEKQRAEAEKQAANASRDKGAAQRSQAAGAVSAKSGKGARGVVRIRDLDFVDKKQAARIVIEVSGEASPRVLESRGRKAILELPAAKLPSSLERKLDTSRYRGPVQAISSYQDPRSADTVRVVVELSEPVKSTLKRSGNTYYWDFAKPELSKNTAQADAGEAGKARARTVAPMVVGGYGASSTPITQKTVAQLSQGKRKVYRGTKIDLDFKDADIHNLLRLLADVGGVNIVIPDEIQARVTVRMRRVPWDQALEVILASKGLWYRREGNLYRIAPRKQLDAEDEAEAQRRANLVKAEAPEPEIFTLNYAVAKDVKNQLTPLLSPKGRIEVDNRTNSLIINDIRSHRRRIIELLTRIDTQTPQVQIEARIVEARSSFTREIGVQWGGSASASQAGGNATGLIFPNSVGVRGGADDNQTNATGVILPSDFAVNLPAAVGSGAGGAIGLSLGSFGGNFNLNLRLSALEDTGSVRIISAPKITVLNNVQAQIGQGVSIPVSVISANGVQTQFVPADLALTVTPHVSQRDCSIQMDLEVKKNEADFVNTGARGDPSILRKEASTTILVADGETTVIGGIYTRNSGLSYSKVPFFGDLPVLGWFFKNRRENDERTEVLVFVTPKITNKAFLRCE